LSPPVVQAALVPAGGGALPHQAARRGWPLWTDKFRDASKI
jgi:hypothetical protein